MMFYTTVTIHLKSFKSMGFPLKYFIAGIWLINGLFCKLMNMVPRHEAIVARILGGAHAHILTLGIGILEMLMAAWILSSLKAKSCAVTQVVLIAAMNIIEFTVAPDLLLFGRWNILFALMLIFIIYYQAFGTRYKIAVP